MDGTFQIEAQNLVWRCEQETVVVRPWGQDGVRVQATVANESGSFGEEAYTIIRHLLFLHERLKPYILAQMKAAHTKGLPSMRLLFVNFPGEPAAWNVSDQFMLGPDLLAAPVLDEGVRGRSVYFPSGAIWVDAWNGVAFEGGHGLRSAPYLTGFRRSGARAARIFSGLMKFNRSLIITQPEDRLAGTVPLPW